MLSAAVPQRGIPWRASQERIEGWVRRAVASRSNRLAMGPQVLADGSRFAQSVAGLSSRGERVALSRVAASVLPWRWSGRGGRRRQARIESPSGASHAIGWARVTASVGGGSMSLSSWWPAVR